jgi:hypothetical protein
MEVSQQGDTGGQIDRHGPARAAFELNVKRIDLLSNTLARALLGAGMLGSAAWLLYLVHFQGRGGSPVLVAVGVAIAGLIFLVRAAHATHRACRMRNMCVLVYADGLTFTHGAQTLEIYWNKMREVLQGATRRDLYPRSFRGSIRASIRRGRGTQQYVLMRSDSQCVRLPGNFPRIDELWVIVQEETFKHLWPMCLASFCAGDKIFFGALCADRQGLHKGGELLPWSAVKSIEIDELGQLLVRTGIYTWLADAAGEYPNVHVLRALADHARAKGADQAASVDMLRDLITHARVDHPDQEHDARAVDTVFQAGYAVPRMGKEENE